MHICHVLFIHLSVNEHLVCVYLLVIVNDVAMNKYLLEFLLSMFLAIYTEGELQDRMVIVRLIS